MLSGSPDTLGLRYKLPEVHLIEMENFYTNSVLIISFSIYNIKFIGNLENYNLKFHWNKTFSRIKSSSSLMNRW